MRGISKPRKVQSGSQPAEVSGGVRDVLGAMLYAGYQTDEGERYES